MKNVPAILRRMMPILTLMGLVSPAAAQMAPDAGTVLREAERQVFRIPPTLVPNPAAAAPRPRPAGEVLFRVQRFDVDGVTLIPEKQVQQALSAYLDRDIGFSDLERAMDQVAAVYKQAGWLARVQVPEQDIVDATVRLEVVEGRMGQIRLAQGASPRLSLDRVQRTMSERQQRGQPLNLRLLERGVSVLSDTPGVSVTAALTNGQEEAETDVVMTVGERDRVSGSFMIDNNGSRSTGMARGIFNLNVDNAWTLGEQLGLTLMRSAGTHYAMVSATLPWGYDGWRVGASASALQYELVGRFAASGAQGSADTIGLRAQYPLWRSTTTHINTSFTLDSKDFVNDANGVNVSRKGAVVLGATLSGNRTDTFGEGGYLLWNTTLSAGRMDLSGNVADEAADLAGPRTAGRFAKVAASVSRLQNLSPKTTLWLSLSGQVSDKNLDSSEKFSLGGPYFIRGYPSSEGLGDQGWIGTAELRHALSPMWQVLVFVDHGQVQVHRHAGHVSTASAVPNRYALSSAGLGVSFNLSSKAALRLTASQRLGSNPAAHPVSGVDADGTLDRTRVWLSATLFF